MKADWPDRRLGIAQEWQIYRPAPRERYSRDTAYTPPPSNCWCWVGTAIPTWNHKIQYIPIYSEAWNIRPPLGKGSFRIQVFYKSAATEYTDVSQYIKRSQLRLFNPQMAKCISHFINSGYIISTREQNPKLKDTWKLQFKRKVQQ